MVSLLLDLKSFINLKNSGARWRSRKIRTEKAVPVTGKRGGAVLEE
jgi:hypothetical protein